MPSNRDLYKLKSVARVNGPDRMTGETTQDLTRARAVRDIVPSDEIAAIVRQRSEDGLRRLRRQNAQVATANRFAQPRGRICWTCGEQSADVGDDGCNDKKACARRAESWR